MRYFVLGPGGSAYGPADLETLARWAQEGRVAPETFLREESSGVSISAAKVSGIFASDEGEVPGPPPIIVATSTSYSKGKEMPELPLHVYSQFNWGAFFFTWLWGLNHEKPVLLVTLFIALSHYQEPKGDIIAALISLGFSIWAGKNGNQWAWESGRFKSVDELQACEGIWARWALSFFVLLILASLVGVFLVVNGFIPGPNGYQPGQVFQMTR